MLKKRGDVVMPSLAGDPPPPPPFPTDRKHWTCVAWLTTICTFVLFWLKVIIISLNLYSTAKYNTLFHNLKTSDNIFQIYYRVITSARHQFFLGGG